MRWTNIYPGGSSNTPRHTLCRGNRDKLWPFWHLARVRLLKCLIKFCKVKLSHVCITIMIKKSNVVKFSLIFFSGYVYLIFDSEKSVKALLASCTHDFCNGGDWYFKISSRRMRCKEVNKYFRN